MIRRDNLRGKVARLRGAGATDGVALRIWTRTRKYTFRETAQRKALRSKRAERIVSEYLGRERNRPKKHELQVVRALKPLCGSAASE